MNPRALLAAGLVLATALPALSAQRAVAARASETTVVGRMLPAPPLTIELPEPAVVRANAHRAIRTLADELGDALSALTPTPRSIALRMEESFAPLDDTLCDLLRTRGYAVRTSARGGVDEDEILIVFGGRNLESRAVQLELRSEWPGFMPLKVASDRELWVGSQREGLVLATLPAIGLEEARSRMEYGLAARLSERFGAAGSEALEVVRELERHGDLKRAFERDADGVVAHLWAAPGYLGSAELRLKDRRQRARQASWMRIASSVALGVITLLGWLAADLKTGGWKRGRVTLLCLALAAGGGWFIWEGVPW